MDDDLMRADERDCAFMLDQLEGVLLEALDESTPIDEGPRFTRVLQVSALLRLAGRLAQEAIARDPDDRERYVAMVQEVAHQVAPWSTASGRKH